MAITLNGTTGITTPDVDSTDLTATGNFTSRGIDDNATSTAMTLDTSGNLLVGKTTTAFGTQGARLSSVGTVIATSSGNAPAELNRLTSDGDIAAFYKDSTKVGSIKSRNSESIMIGSDYGTDAYICLSNDNVFPVTSTGAVKDGATNLGVSTGRWKDLYLSGGVYLGGTGAANKLDDYEEGTWTPSIGTGTAVFNLSSYVKVGNLVHVHTQVEQPSDIASGNVIDIFGLPFTAVSDRAMTLGILTQYGPTSAITGGYTSTGTNIRLYYTSASVYESVKHNQLQSTSFSAYISLSYYTA